MLKPGRKLSEAIDARRPMQLYRGNGPPTGSSPTRPSAAALTLKRPVEPERYFDYIAENVFVAEVQYCKIP